MYKSLEQFKSKVEALNESLTKLRQKKEEYEATKAAAEQERESLLMSEALEGKEPDPKHLERLRKQIVGCDAEIAEIEARRELIEGKRAESLAQFLPDLRKDRDKEIDKLKREADANFEDARKILCEYLLALQKVGNVRSKAAELNNEFVHYARMVDPEKYDRPEWGRHPLPIYVLFNDNDGLKLGVREKDQTQALNGVVDPFVTLYQMTGELVDSREAGMKLREVTK